MTKEEIDLSLASMESWIQFFAVLVAIGIVGEVGLGLRHWRLNKQLHRLEQTEDLNRKKETARLTKEAAEARLETAKIQEKLAWRELSAEQQTRIAEKLKQFAGTEFEIRAFKDPESLNLLAIMVEILHVADWKQIEPSGFLDIPTKYGPVTGSLDSGIHVRNDSTRENLQEPASMFAAALVAEDIVAKVHGPRLNEIHTERLQISIGKKP